MLQIYLNDFMQLFVSLLTYKQYKATKWKKDIDLLYLILEEQIRVESVSHVLLKHHTFICVRCALAESVTLSGLTQNFPWIFLNLSSIFGFSQIRRQRTILKYQVAKLQFCNSLDRCLSFTF